MDRLLASVLAGGVSLEAIREPLDQETLLEAAVDHDVDVLLRHLLRIRGTWSGVPQPLQSTLDARARHQSGRDMLRTRELIRVLRAFRDANLPALVIKGAAMSHTHYPASYLRPRYDTDLLVRKPDVPRACRALGDLGYHRVNSVSRDAVRTQRTFERELERGVPEYIDLHWAISNRPLFAGMLSFDELAGEAVRVDALSDAALDARAPGPTHALLLACIHRIAHHNGWRKLIWLYDIGLIASGLSAPDWNRFQALAAQKRIVAVCDEALGAAAAVFPAGYHQAALKGCATLQRHNDVAQAFRPAVAGRFVAQAFRAARMVATEPSAAYLDGVGTRWESLLLDLRGAKGLPEKLRLVAGHAFPDAAYMREAHGAANPFALAAAYLRRLMYGVRRMAAPVTRQV
jgi:hypothetical protein